MRQIERKPEPAWLPDLAISSEDVTYDREQSAFAVTVHNVGSDDAGPFVVLLKDEDGEIVASRKMPGLEAPADLKPRRAVARFSVAPQRRPRIQSVTVQSLSPVLEITDENNVLP